MRAVNETNYLVGLDLDKKAKNELFKNGF